MLAAIVAILALNPAAAIPNPSFEQGAEAPSEWSTHTWGGEGTVTWSDEAHTGSRSACIESRDGADLGFFAIAPVRPRTLYRLSGWIRTEDVEAGSGRGAQFNIHGQRPARTQAVIGTQDWTRVEAVFETPGADTVQVNCLLGGWGLSTGKAWFDDVSLEPLDEETGTVDITLHAERVAHPISPYVYGQFIEHLGRCIYGGIWAEMLADRKFYYTAGADESPWHPFGAAAMSMDSSDPYAGGQAPVIQAMGTQPAGIRQDGLGIVEGKSYTGRLVAKAEPSGTRVSIRLRWGNGEGQFGEVQLPALSKEYTTHAFDFEAGASTDDAALEIIVPADAQVTVAAVSLMPRDNVHGMRPDTLALLKELDAPVYRWPGGNFVSGYDWRDGIGDPDKRPPRKNPAWQGIESNDFGIDEFMTFCRELGTEPLVVVNTGAGDAGMALAELEYANGAPDTEMGRLRSANGHRKPYGVVWWGIGNEMYGDWQIGHMPLEDYVKKHNRFVEQMRQQDPSIKVVAVGATGEWSKTMLAKCADHMDALSEHFYCGEQGTTYSHVRQLPDAVRAKAEAHRRYHETLPALSAKQIPIALDEWNYWYGPHLYGELGVRYYLRDALGIAAGLHEMFRNSDVFVMANYAQTVNVIGCIKTSATDAVFATTGLPLKLYRRRFGVTPIEVSGEVTPLDVAAAWTEDRRAITLGIVNACHEGVETELAIEDAAPTGEVRRWTITGPDAMACNAPGEPMQVVIEEAPGAVFKNKLTVPPLSITLLEIAVE